MSSKYILSSDICKQLSTMPLRKLLIKKLSDNAVIPKKASPLDAGYDLSSAIDCIVPAHGKKLIPTDLAISCPLGTYGRIAPRSGLANKYFIDVGAGVIDASYTGNVGIILFNHSDADFAVNKGDRIAQLILEKIEHDIEVEEIDNLNETYRGANGFGSTGIA